MLLDNNRLNSSTNIVSSHNLEPAILKTSLAGTSAAISNSFDFQLSSSKGATCSDDKAYLAIVITVLPLWGILTSLIVLLLLSFHRHLKATKVYDNCTKETAQYTYYVEIRTGDTSSSYNRRRTTITIDMFDDNQTTLARVAVPGHIIFGKKDAPIATVDDERYYELRVTRFWLYRSIRLRKVATIRLTHSCTEPEARIMVYGIEIKSAEPDRSKMFFPVMGYISAYGSTVKPNACFDLDTSGSISYMGGSQVDFSSVSAHLSPVDYTLLIYLFGSLVFYITSYEIFAESFTDIVTSTYKGATVGLVVYFILLSVGLELRTLVKHYYAQRIGLGCSAAIYYINLIIIFVIGTLFWILTTVKTHKSMCADHYKLWVLSITVACLEAVVLAILTWLINYMIQLSNPKYGEQYVLPEDVVGFPSSHEPPSRGRATAQTAPLVTKYVGMTSKSTPQQASYPPHLPSWPTMNTAHTHSPYGYHSPIQSYPPQQSSLPYSPQQQVMMNPMVQPSPSYKTLTTTYQTTGYDTSPTLPHSPVAQTSPHTTTYHHQTVMPQQTANAQGIKVTKKVGSNESTGSTYYQQLMKNKGGVKSISQYGELLKQKKAAKGKSQPNK